MANKFEYEIDITGNGLDEAKKLNQALKQLEQISILKGVSQDIKKTTAELAKAKAEVTSLSQEMKKPGGDKLATDMQRAKKVVDSLDSSLKQQVTTYISTAKSLEKAGVNTRKLSQEQERLLRTTGKSATAFDKSKNLIDKTSKSFGGLAVSIASAIAAFATVAGAAGVAQVLFQAGVEAQRLDVTFKAVTGSSRAAAEELLFLNDLSNELGLNFLETAKSAKSLSAATKGTALEGKATRAILVSAAEAATVLGLSVDDTNGILNAFSQMVSKGNVQAEELRGQLGERLPGAFQLAAKSMGLTTSELGKQLELGNVLATDLLPKLSKALHEAYGGAAVEASKNATQELNRFQSAWFELKKEVAEAGFLEMATENLRRLTEWLKDPSTIDSARQLADVLSIIAEGIIRVGAGIKGVLEIGSAVFAESISAFEGLAAGVAWLTDSLGLTSGEYERLKKNSADWHGAAKEGVDDAVKAFGVMNNGLKETSTEYKKTGSVAKDTFEGMDEEINKLNKNQAELTKNQLEGLQKQYDKQIDLISKAQDEILNRERSLQEELTEFNLTGKSAGVNFWMSLREQAKKYYDESQGFATKARGLLATGDEKGAAVFFERAIASADAAKDKYAEIGNEIQVIATVWDSVSQEWITKSDSMANAGISGFISQKEVTIEAIEAMKASYEQYASTVKSLSDEIAGRSQSLQSELREMARSGMDAVGAWQDLKNEAESFYNEAQKAISAGQAAIKAGDEEAAAEAFLRAKEYADEARQAYKSLNKEVRDGKKTFVSQDDALRTSMAGVKKSGELAIDALKKQKTAAEEAASVLKTDVARAGEEYMAAQRTGVETAMEGVRQSGQAAIDIFKEQEAAAKRTADVINKQADFKLSTEVFDESIRKTSQISDNVQLIGDTWTNVIGDALTQTERDMEDINSMFDKLTRDREVTITVKTVEAKALGGAIGALKMQLGGPVGALKMAVGGGVSDATNGFKFAGYGGGDKVHVIAEAGEHMIRKESVRAAGPGTAEAFNAGRFDIVIKNLMRRFGSALKMQTGGAVSRFVVPSLPALKMQAGGAVSGAVSGMVPVAINLVPGEPAVSGFFDEQNLELLQRQEARNRKYKS